MMLANLGGLYSAGKSELQALISSLFGAGQQGLLFVPQPVVLNEQRLYKLDDFTDPVTADGDPVGGGKEVSGNDNHLTQPTSADRPTYNTDGSLHWVGFDGVGDSLSMDAIVNALGTSSTIMILLRRKTVDKLVLVNEPGTDTFVFVFESGSTSNPDALSGTPAYRVDGVGITRSRDALHDATSDLAWHIVEASEADLKTNYEGGLQVGGYFGSAYQDPVDIAGIIVIDGNDTQKRDEARQYLANLAGITL